MGIENSDVSRRQFLKDLFAGVVAVGLGVDAAAAEESIQKIIEVRKLEGNESMERPPRFKTVRDEILQMHEDGSKTQRVLECNGIHHRICVDRIMYDEVGDVIGDEELSRSELTPCDGNHA